MGQPRQKLGLMNTNFYSKLWEFLILLWILSTLLRTVECNLPSKKDPGRLLQLRPIADSTPPSVLNKTILSFQTAASASLCLENFVFIQVLNNVKFIKSIIFDQIRNFFINRKSKLYVEGKIAHFVYRNETGQDYITVGIRLDLFTMVQPWSFWYWRIFYSKENQILKTEVDQQYNVTISEREIIILTDDNRTAMIQKLDPITQQIMSFIVAHPLYKRESKLLSIIKMHYQHPSTARPTEQHILRYYFPSGLNTSFQFLEFHYLTYENKPPIELKRIIATQREAFNATEKNGFDMKELMQVYVQSYILEPAGIQNFGDYNVDNIRESLERFDVYRVDVIGQGKVTEYEIDIDNGPYNTILSIRPLSNAK